MLINGGAMDCFLTKEGTQGRRKEITRLHIATSYAAGGSLRITPLSFMGWPFIALFSTNFWNVLEPSLNQFYLFSFHSLFIFPFFFLSFFYLSFFFFIFPFYFFNYFRFLFFSIILIYLQTSSQIHKLFLK